MTVMETTPAPTAAPTRDPAGPEICPPPPAHPRPDGQDHYTISEVVAVTGLTAHTLRWYERIGLMPHIDRSHTGQRRYSNRDLDWLDLVGKQPIRLRPVDQRNHFIQRRTPSQPSITNRQLLLPPAHVGRHPDVA